MRQLARQEHQVLFAPGIQKNNLALATIWT
ncbi:hypothetical protein DSUL_140078 [Desulfovibrionales bacterium]